MSPIHIWIGTEPAQHLPTAVLKHSILKRTKTPVEFHDLAGSLGLKMYTGFSFYRWSIPSRSGFVGRAIYLDADIVCNCDVKELAEMDLGQNTHAARPVGSGQGYFTSVMLLDCEKLKVWDFPSMLTSAQRERNYYNQIMWGRGDAITGRNVKPLDHKWNAMDQLRAMDCGPEAKFYHYTTIPTQPWKAPGHPQSSIWTAELLDAVRAGALKREDVQREMDNGHCRKGLLGRELMAV